MAADAGESRSSPTLFLCGDVMSGRGIDQIQARSVPPELHEPWIKNAMDYVRLAERENGPVPQPVDPAYVWGEALSVWAETPHDLRFVNLETSITTSDDFWPSKGIHYRMHPDNVACLRAAGIDGCTLANNHVMDLGYRGLEETLTTLQRADIAVTGAGSDAAAAAEPAVSRWRAAPGWSCTGSPSAPAACRRNGQPAGPGRASTGCRTSRRGPPTPSPTRCSPAGARATSPWRRSTGAGTGATRSPGTNGVSPAGSSTAAPRTSSTAIPPITRKAWSCTGAS